MVLFYFLTLAIIFGGISSESTYTRDQIEWDVTYWSRVLKGYGEEVGFSVVEDLHGFGVCGKTKSQGSESSDDIFLMKTDEYGIPLWSRVYHQDNDFDSSCMDVDEVIEDETHALTGHFNFGNYTGMFVMETSVNGELGWIEEYYEPSWHVEGRKITTLTDSNVIVSGLTHNNTEFSKLFVAQFNYTGNCSYFKQFSHDIYSDHFDMTKTKTTVLFAGTMLDYTKKPFMIKFDGGVQLEKSYELPDYKNGTARSLYCFQVDTRKTCILIIEVFPHNNSFIFAEMKKGDLSVSKANLIHLGLEEIVDFGGITKVYQTSDLGFVMAMNIEFKKTYEAFNRKKIGFLKLAADLSIESLSYHDDGSDPDGEKEETIGYLAHGLDDTGYVAVGSIYDTRTSTSSVFLAKLDDNGVTCFTSSNISIVGSGMEDIKSSITAASAGITVSDYTTIKKADNGFTEVESLGVFGASEDCCITCNVTETTDCLLTPGIQPPKLPDVKETYTRDQITGWDPTYWSRIVTGYGSENGVSVVEDVKGFGVCGKTKSFGSQSSDDIMVMKTDEFGTPLWSRVYHQSNELDASCMDISEVVADESHAITGFYNNGTVTGTFVMEIDVDGNKGWVRELYQPGKIMEGRKVTTTDNLKVVVSGFTKVDSEFSTLFFAKFNATTGEEYFFKELNFDIYSEHYDMTKTKNTIFFAGTHYYEGQKKAFVLKLGDSDVDLQKEYEAVDSSNLTARSMFCFQKDTRKKCVLVMEMEPHRNSFIFAEVSKTNLGLDHAEFVHLGMDGIIEIGDITKVHYTADEGFIMAMNVEFHSGDNILKRIGFVKLTAAFEIEFFRFHDDGSDPNGETEETIGYLAEGGADGGFVAVGSVYNTITSTSSVLLVKLDENGGTCFSSSEVGLEGYSVTNYDDRILASNVDVGPSTSDLSVLESFDGFVDVPALGVFSSAGECCVECESLELTELCLLKPGIQPDTTANVVDERYYKSQISWDVAYWSRTIVGYGKEMGFSVVEDIHGFGVCGKTYTQGSENSDILLMKTDEFGTPVWSKVYHQGTDYDSSCMDIDEVVADESHAMTGYYSDPEDGGDTGMFVMETKVDGELGWAREFYETGKNVEGRKTMTTDDSLVHVSGLTEENSEFSKLFVAQFTDTGVKNYFKQFDLDIYSDHYDMHKSKYGLFFFGTIYESGKKKVFFIKYGAGAIDKQKKYEMAESSNVTARSIFCFQIDTRKTCVLIMEMEPHRNSFIFAEVSKGNLGVEHAKYVHLGIEGISRIGDLTNVFFTADDGFIMAMNVEVVYGDTILKRVGFVKLDSDFKIEFFRVHDDGSDPNGETEETIGYLAEGVGGDGFVAVGTVYDTITGKSELFLAKLDGNGETCFTSSDFSTIGADVVDFDHGVKAGSVSFTLANYTSILEAHNGFEEVHSKDVFDVSGDCCVDCDDDLCLLLPGTAPPGNDDDDDDDQGEDEYKDWIESGGWSVFAIGLPVIFICFCFCAIMCGFGIVLLIVSGVWVAYAYYIKVNQKVDDENADDEAVVETEMEDKAFDEDEEQVEVDIDDDGDEVESDDDSEEDDESD